MADDKQNQNQNRPEEETTPTASGGQQTTLEPATRRTGQGALNQDVRSGAQAEAPGDKNTRVEGDPNQGTEAR